jgi:hypothetical protein
MDITYGIAKALGGEKKTSTGWRCICPVHDDHNPSLFISISDQGKILVNCKAGCDQTTVFNYLKDAAILPQPNPKINGYKKPYSASPSRKEVAVYKYTDAAGALLFEKVRYDPKGFASRFIDSTGKMVYGSGGHSKNLYLRHTLNNVSGRIVVIVEGEKDADFIVSNYGLIATTVPNGSSTWCSSFATVFVGADVIICPDNDEPGRVLSSKIINDVLPVARSLKLITLPSGKDISDWGGNLDSFMAIVEATKQLDKMPPVHTFDMRDFAISRADCDAMRKKMLDDVFIMRGLALLGQITVIYAKPNAGKTLLTLWMLTEACRNGVIKGKDVLYVNADDSYKGLIEKTELVSIYGIGMLSPGINGFKSKDLISYIDLHVQTNTAKGLIIVMDTMKKFTDTMDKKVSSVFTSKLREFTIAGGSVIMLAHANKHRDTDGKLVAGGTSDIPDDVDCTYFLDDVDSSETDYKQVIFENGKLRGENEHIIAFTHLAKEKYRGYSELFMSIRRLSNEDTETAKAAVLESENEDKYNQSIIAIIEAINLGHAGRGKIVKFVMEEFAIPRREILKTLDMFTGKKWKKIVMDRGEVNYSLVNLASFTKDDYARKGSFYD